MVLSTIGFPTLSLPMRRKLEVATWPDPAGRAALGFPPILASAHYASPNACADSRADLAVDGKAIEGISVPGNRRSGSANRRGTRLDRKESK